MLHQVVGKRGRERFKKTENITTNEVARFSGNRAVVHRLHDVVVHFGKGNGRDEVDVNNDALRAVTLVLAYANARENFKLRDVNALVGFHERSSRTSTAISNIEGNCATLRQTERRDVQYHHDECKLGEP